MNILILIFLLSPILATTISVGDLIKLGEAYSPQIRGQELNLSASENLLKQSRILSNPVFTFQGGSLKSGSQAGAVADFTLGQPLPWPGKRKARIESQEFSLKIAQLTKDEAKLEVSHRIFINVAELAALQELEGHYSERKRRFSLIEKSLRSRPQASPKQKADRDLIESQINLMEKTMLDIIARKEGLLWDLKIFTNSSFDRVVFPWESLPTALNRNDYVQSLENSPRFKQIKLELSLAENKITQARLEARPDVLVGVNYRQENVAPVNHFYHGQVSVIIPIVDYGQHSVEVARAERSRTSAFHHFERDQLSSLVHQYFAQYEASKKATEVFKFKNLGQIEKKFYDAEESFRKGLIDALTFLQIDSQVHENIDQIYLSRVSYVASISNLNLLIGKAPEI
jgi:outer membrane protein TolC